MNAESRPHHGLDPVIHAPLRLTLMSALAGVDSADFPTLRDVLQITDSALSKQLAILESAGYIEITKGKAGRRPRTWAALTPLGQTALEAHIAALQAITDLATNLGDRTGQHGGSAQRPSMTSAEPRTKGVRR